MEIRCELFPVPSDEAKAELLESFEKQVRSPIRDTATHDGWLILDFDFANEDEITRFTKLVDSLRSYFGTFLLMRKFIEMN